MLGEWLIAASFWLVGVLLLLLTRGNLGLGSTGEDNDSSENVRIQEN